MQLTNFDPVSKSAGSTFIQSFFSKQKSFWQTQYYTNKQDIIRTQRNNIHLYNLANKTNSVCRTLIL